jgi:hypothetical protein
MKEKILALLSKLKDLISKAIAASPLVAGIIIGYFGKPIIQFVIIHAVALVKYLVG